MKTLLVALILIADLFAGSADSQLIPLVDPNDPIRITNAAMVFEGDVRPVAIVELENEATVAINSADVWLNATRFFTRAEVERAGDRKVWDCGRISRADLDPPQAIAPHARAVVRMSLDGSCVHNREHEHFFVTVQYIGKGPASASWKREPSEFSRLLAAAQPHP